MASSITSMNAVYSLAVPGVFASVQLQGWSMDEMFATDPIEEIEVQMGLDATLSGGLVPVAPRQVIMLKADSPSIQYFESWRAAQLTAKDVYIANATIIQTSINMKYNCVGGFLTNYSILADARKVLQPRRLTITWESVTAATA